VVPFRLRVEAHDLTIHGKEGAHEIPYAHVDDLIAYIKIISIFEREYGFNSLTLNRPVLHIIVYPDGTTNQPQPKSVSVETKASTEQLFSLSIRRLQITHGELLWNNQRIPLEVDASQISAEMNYAFLHSRYDGSLNLGDLNTAPPGVPPFHSSVAAQFSLAKDSIEIKSLRWVSKGSHLEVSGRVEDFQRPKF